MLVFQVLTQLIQNFKRIIFCFISGLLFVHLVPFFDEGNFSAISKLTSPMHAWSETLVVKAPSKLEDNKMSV